MHTFVVVTTADPRRPGLAYKVELPAYAVDPWYVENKDVLIAERTVPLEGVNTTITWIDESGNVTVREFAFKWPMLHELLYQADYITAGNDRKPGRPEKRALLLTTSKERRQGSLVARQSY